MSQKSAISWSIVLFLILVWASPSAWAAKYKVSDVSNGGTISGTIALNGKAPKAESILITKNNDVCGKGYRSIQWVPTGPNNSLVDVVVYLKKIKAGKDWGKGQFKSKPVMDQKECLFTPWVQVVKKGDVLTVKNSDPVLHNIHIRELIGIKVGKARGVKRTMLNEAQPGEAGNPAPDLTAKIKPRRGNYIAINCEAHNFMFAWMFAADHPYVAVTDKNGKYSIGEVPPGKYTLVAWHPTLGPLEEKITVKAGGKGKTDFAFKP